MSVVARALRPIATMFPCKGYPLINGRLAQRLERSPHTREVKGSNPLSPTIPFLFSINRRKFGETRHLLCPKCFKLHPAPAVSSGESMVCYISHFDFA